MNVAIEQFVFTDLPRGKGVDPSAAGYQVAAVTPGLDADARALLGSIALHYGETIYRHAPRAALDRETDWRTKAKSLDRVPREVLDAFPVIWSYDRLRDDLFALTRIGYLGLTHDGRTGNFLAHALVFAPGCLERFSWNPLTLRHCKHFRDVWSAEDLAVPTELGDGESRGALTSDTAVAPYRDRLAALVGAVSMAAVANRPVMLCGDDWKQAPSLFEAILDLVPPSVRCRTTVCTFEGDRNWLPAGPGGGPTGETAAHQLVFLPATPERPISFRADECQATCAVFNFAAAQFSDLGEPRPYAVFAARCVLDGQANRLTGLQDLLERLGQAQDRAAWDALVGAALGDRPAPEEMTAAARCLADASTQPRQVEVALEYLLRPISELAEAGQAEHIAAAAEGLARLVDRLPDEQRQAALARLREMSVKALGQRRARMVAALVRASGGGRETFLLGLLLECLGDAASKISLPDGTDEAQALAELCAEGATVQHKKGGSTGIGQFLVLAFRGACRAGVAGKFWKRLGDDIVKPWLQKEWEKETPVHVRDLLDALPIEQSPEARSWLYLRLVEAISPAGEELIGALVEVVRAAGRCPDYSPTCALVLRIVGEKVSEGNRSAVVLGRLADAAAGTPAWDALWRAYAEARPEKAEQLLAVRRELVHAGATHVVGRDLLGEVTGPDDWTPARWKKWRESELIPALHPTLCSLVAARLTESCQGEPLLPLARDLLGFKPEKTTAEQGRKDLFAAVVRVLPPGPLADDWASPLSSPSPDLAAEVLARLRVLQFLREVEQKRRQAGTDWSPAAFPAKKEAWTKHAPSLDKRDRRAVLEWCLGTFEECGVLTAEHVEGLLDILAGLALDTPDAIAAAVHVMLAGRDPVTDVLTALAFTSWALKASDRDLPERGRVVAAVVAGLDRRTRSLFVEHLEKRHRHRDAASDKREARLREVADLPQQQPAEPPANATQQPPSGLLGSARRLWSRLTGKGSSAK
jgi:hypothetical protein